MAEFGIFCFPNFLHKVPEVFRKVRKAKPCVLCGNLCGLCGRLDHHRQLDPFAVFVNFSDLDLDVLVQFDDFIDV